MPTLSSRAIVRRPPAAVNLSDTATRLLNKTLPYAGILISFLVYIHYWAYVAAQCPVPCFRGYDDSRHYQDFLGLLDGSWPGTQVLVQSPLPGFYLGFLHLIFRAPIDRLVIPHLIQVFLATLTCALAYKIAAVMFSRPVGLATILLLTFYEFVKFYATTIETASLLAFFLTATLYLLVRHRTRQTFLRLGLAGICLGISMIGRQNNLVLLGAAALWWYLLKTPLKKLTANLLILAFFALLIVSPVFVRNSMVEGRFAPYVVNHGIGQLTMGNLPGAPGTYWDQSTLSIKPTLQFITQQPLDWLLLTLRKFRLFFTFPWSPAYLHELPVSWVVFWFLGIIICGAYFFKTFSPERSLLHFWLAFYAASIIITHVEDEYRMPLLPVIVIFISAALVSLLQQLFRLASSGWKQAGSRGFRPALLLLVWSCLVLAAFAWQVPGPIVSYKVDSIQSDRVYGGVVVGQSFEVGCPNLSRIRLKMSAGQPAGSITFRLKEGGPVGEGPELVSQRINVTELTSLDYYTISFPPVPNSAGKEYTFYLDTSALTSPEEGLVFAGGRHPFAESLNRIEFEPRLTGGAFVSLGSLDGNLAFSAACDAGPVPLITTAIDRLSEQTPSPPLAKTAIFILLVLHVLFLLGSALFILYRFYRYTP